MCMQHLPISAIKVTDEHSKPYGKRGLCQIKYDSNVHIYNKNLFVYIRQHEMLFYKYRKHNDKNSFKKIRE
jgi:hypothetical protein